MYQHVNYNDFKNAFRASGRETQFSRMALLGLFTHLEQLEEDTGTPIELDVIALCCEYSEHDYASEAAKAYGKTFDTEQEALDWLEDNTMVVPFVGGFLVHEF